MLLHVHGESMQFDLVCFASAVPLGVVSYHVQALLGPELVHYDILLDVNAQRIRGPRYCIMLLLRSHRGRTKMCVARSHDEI